MPVIATLEMSVAVFPPIVACVGFAFGISCASVALNTSVIFEPPVANLGAANTSLVKASTPIVGATVSVDADTKQVITVSSRSALQHR